MKTLLKILATGVFATLPVLLLYLLIGQLFAIMMALSQPLMDILPEKGWLIDLDERAWAALLLALFVFLVGLLALTKMGQRLGDWLEAKALSRLPDLWHLERSADGFPPDIHHRQERTRQPGRRHRHRGRQNYSQFAGERGVWPLLCDNQPSGAESKKATAITATNRSMK